MVTNQIPHHLKVKSVNHFPRLPLEGQIDLTYRCNNNCRHCWTRLPIEAPEKQKELTFDEIINIVDQARKMGCQRWYMSGGEPMARPDFRDIFEYITSHSNYYMINTNGTFITPEVAVLMKKRGRKWIALYGATAEVHDQITRNSGSFEAMLQGCAYLQEAKVDFMVQVIPMKDNYHQYQDMIKFAQSLTPFWRVGATWLFLSAYNDPKKNKEIREQRLPPRDACKLEEPDCFYQEAHKGSEGNSFLPESENDGLFSKCISTRNDFHLDAYGQMSFCKTVKDPSLRFDLRKGSFKEAWDTFIPSLKNLVKSNDEFLNNCGSCQIKKYCTWCPVYAYLEHGRYTAKIDYLCRVAEENKKFREKWLKDHRRFYNIAGITIQVNSDLPIKDSTFQSKFKPFEVKNPGKEVIKIRHRFFLPDLHKKDLGKKIAEKIPWTIYKKDNFWIYLSIPQSDGIPKQIMIFNNDHSNGVIYNGSGYIFGKGNIQSLTISRSDQLLLARILADKQAFYIHSSGVNLNDQGLLFVGHSEAGKSTMVKMLKDKAKILCDDRVIIRHWPDGFRIHGTWSHGEVSLISPESAPLKSIFFLKKAKKNRLTLISHKKEAIKNILACLVRSLETRDWWEKILSLVEKVVLEVPCYWLEFDKSGRVVKLLEDFCVPEKKESDYPGVHFKKFQKKRDLLDIKNTYKLE